MLNTIGETCCDSGLVSKQPETTNLLSYCKSKRLKLQEQLNNVDAAIKALERNPEFNTLLELIAKVK